MIKLVLTLFLILAVIAPVRGTDAAPAASAPQAAGAQFGCGYASQVDALLEQTTQEEWSGWVKRLSGAEDALVGGKYTRITTRSSAALFDGTSRGYDYVREQVETWYPGQVEEDPYTGIAGKTWKNLILDIPGSVYPDEIVILSAHLDSVSTGADDNASGSAVLLEAARILQGQSLPRSLRLIWFTGEEQGLYGSLAYTRDHALTGVVGVINADMMGFDSNNDRCFELHVGTMPASEKVGRCFVNAIQTYGLDLRYDYLIGSATTRSDHASFWRAGVGAVEVLENVFNDQQPNGCAGADPSPYYHTPNDTFANMSPAYGFAVSRAALAAAFSLASPVPLQMLYFPFMLRY